MDNAKKFKRWITKEVLPSIRKNGRYELNHKPFKMLAFNIQTEFDLHKKVVNFIRNNYPKALFTATLGENQLSSDMRLRSYNLGYHLILSFKIFITCIQDLQLSLKVQLVTENYQSIKM